MQTPFAVISMAIGALVLGLGTPAQWRGEGVLEARPTPPLSVLGLRMGKARIETVRAMLERAGATVTESKGEGPVALRLEARRGRYNGIDPRHDYVAFEFSQEAPDVLDAVTISYGDASERLEYGRMDEFIRRWGISDGAEAQTWHGIVRGVSITLWRDPQSREFTESYSVYTPPAPQ